MCPLWIKIYSIDESPLAQISANRDQKQSELASSFVTDLALVADYLRTQTKLLLEWDQGLILDAVGFVEYSKGKKVRFLVRFAPNYWFSYCKIKKKKSITATRYFET